MASPIKENEQLQYLRSDSVINLLGAKHANAIIEYTLRVAKNAPKIIEYSEMYEALETGLGISLGRPIELLPEPQKAQLVIEMAQVPEWTAVGKDFMSTFVQRLQQPEETRSLEVGNFLLSEVVWKACAVFTDAYLDLLSKPKLKDSNIQKIAPFIETIEQIAKDASLPFRDKQHQIGYELQMMGVEISLVKLYLTAPKEQSDENIPGQLDAFFAKVAELQQWVSERQVLY